MKKYYQLSVVVIVLSFSNIFAQVPSYVPTNGLVGWWPFNGNANDESGNGNNGTVNGAILTTDRFGNATGAFSFDGLSQYIEVPSNSGLSVSNAYTISTWISADIWSFNAPIDQHSVISKIANGDWYGGYEIRTGGNGFIMHSGNIGSNFVIGAGGYIENTWHHVVVTFDGNYVRSFINGSIVDSVNRVGSIQTSGIPLRIGRRGGAGFYNNWFDGKIDDIGIWNRALSDDEILTLYLNPKKPEIYSLQLDTQNTNSLNLSIDLKTPFSATVTIEYGTSTGDYSATTTSQIINGTSTTTTLSFNITGLDANEQYFLRVRAENSVGIKYSEEYIYGEDDNEFTDTDGDGVSDIIENEAPNSGDGNGDGIKDALQTNVTSLNNNISGYYQTIVSDNSISFNDVEEVEVEKNSKYNFPFGAIKFKVNSSATTIKILYHGISKLSNYIYRKKRFGDTWFNFSNVVFGSENINGNITAKVELTLKDGGEEDYDGFKNGFIIDPGGPAILISDNIPFWNYWIFAISILLIIITYIKYNFSTARKKI